MFSYLKDTLQSNYRDIGIPIIVLWTLYQSADREKLSLSGATHSLPVSSSFRMSIDMYPASEIFLIFSEYQTMDEDMLVELSPNRLRF